MTGSAFSSSSSEALLSEQQQESQQPRPIGEGAAATAASATAVTRPLEERPKSLPDIDDRAMNNVMEYVDKSQQDLFYSFASDAYFMVGGVAYVALALGDTAGADDAFWYKVVTWIAPLVYLANSMVDLEWAFSVKFRTKKRKEMVADWLDWRILLDDDYGVEDPKQNPSPEDGTLAGFWMRVRKHAAHRRTILAALTFGGAAMFAVLALVDVAGTGDACSLVSTHVYIVSALTACSGKRTRPWLYGNGLVTWHNPERLEDLGDLLFLLGSAVDAILFDWNFDAGSPGWSILAASLWCIDACLYLRSDIIMACQQQSREESEGSGALV